MPTLHDLIKPPNIPQHKTDKAFKAGFDSGLEGELGLLPSARTKFAKSRASVGLIKRDAPHLLTPPSSNAKLTKSSGVKPAWGLTLQHHVSRFDDLGVVNACPWAGECTQVCVLDTGQGRYPSVQLARRARTHYFATYPLTALYRMGYELGRAVRKSPNGEILFRPNVNSDIDWLDIIPSLAEYDGVYTYGYTKDPSILETDGRAGNTVTSYSLHENSDMAAVDQFLRNGGRVAAVTDRKRGEPVKQWWKAAGADIRVVDADLTDEWMFDDGVIGDLSAKGRATTLKPGRFVRAIYRPSPDVPVLLGERALAT